ncbi:MAG: HEAT repeat domain-containing protein [Kiritimatiellae bacterium]|nr:HEAT repeat domain-containing protein [Kiritimatiellia bacterium]
MGRSIACVLVVAAVFLLPGAVNLAVAGDTVESLLAEKALEKAYNAVLVDYLVEEGKEKLPAEQQKAALDQLVTALKAKTHVSKDEQITTALGAAVGLSMGLAGGDVVGEAGADVAGSYASEYAAWVDAGFKLIHAGYKEDAAEFFQWGLTMIPFPQLQARCVEGLALARPGQAYDLLMNMTKEPDTDKVNTALRLLGYLALDKNLAQEKKDALIEKLIEFTKGIMHSTNYRAAIYGLDVSKDKRAVEALSRFKSGMGHDTYDKRAALRSLLLTFADKSVADILKKMTKGGMMTLSNEQDQFWAGSLLIEAGEDHGFEWAEKLLAPAKKSFLAKAMQTKKGPDQRPELVRVLVRHGGDRGRALLAKVIGSYEDKDWLKTWIATGLLELGDKTHIELVKKSLSNPNWDYTAVRIAEALAKHQDYSGLAALKMLIEKEPPKQSGAMKMLGALSGKADETKAEAERLARLRVQIADALGRINHTDGVPLLITLLDDKDQYVRSAAAYALTEMTDAAALAGLAKAVSVDYGTVGKKEIPRNPGIHANVVRFAALRFAQDPGAAPVFTAAAASKYPDVRFLALAVK